MNPAYDWTARFFAELSAAGVDLVVVSPGSRSTPLALTATETPGLRHRVVLDERVAAFVALGAAKVTARPTVLVCTSGTAAANYAPAIVEASLAQVPLIVLTADRPPELRGWGAGQTIDQTRLYGTHVRWYHEPAVLGEAPVATAAPTARRAVAAALGPEAGPVHLNLAAREPLEPDAPVVVAGSAGPPVTTPEIHDDAGAERLVALVERYERGLIVIGGLPPTPDPTGTFAPVVDLAARAGWPVMADALSQLRRGPTSGPPLITAVDLLAKAARASGAGPAPDVVVRLGAAPTSKALRQWLETRPPAHGLLVDPGLRWDDPAFVTTDVVRADPRPVAVRALDGLHVDRRSGTDWSRRWQAADERARSAVEIHLAAIDADGLLTEHRVARAVVDAIPADGRLWASSSMPVRDVDLVLGPGPDRLQVVANRGANGIDGVVASALGAAMADGRPTVALVGDLALQHDLGGLVEASRSAAPLTVVVVDNGGGGIFGFLPVAGLGLERYDELFTTPRPLDLPALAAGLGLRQRAVTTATDLGLAVADIIAGGAPGLVVVPVERGGNLAAHRRLDAETAGVWGDDRR